MYREKQMADFNDWNSGHYLGMRILTIDRPGDIGALLTFSGCQQRSYAQPGH